MAAAKSPDVGIDERHVLLLILAVGLLLRVPGLWQFDAWQDEIYSIYEARDLIHSPFGPGGMELRPLYFLAMHPLAMAVPHATVLLRLPSLIFGLLGIWATWTFTKRHLGVNAAIVATGILAVLPLHINASHIIRYWSLIYLLGVLYAGALLRAITTDSRRDHLLALTWLLLGTLTHPTFAISAVGMTAAAHLVTDKGRFGIRLPSPTAWKMTWMPAVALLLGYYLLLWMFFTTERLVGEAAGSPERLLPALAFNFSPALVTASFLGMLWLLRSADPALRRFGFMTALSTAVSLATLLIGGYLDFLPVSVLYLSAAYPLVLASAGALCLVFGSSPISERDAALVLVLVLAAALSPSTVSYLGDGARFDYRPSLTRIKTDNPRGTVVIWPRVQAMWASPDLESIELRNTMPLSTFDSLLAVRDRFWVVTSQRRYGVVADPDGRKQQWLGRYCDRVLTTGKPRYDFEQYVTYLWECRAGGPAPIRQSSDTPRALPDRD